MKHYNGNIYNNEVRKEDKCNEVGYIRNYCLRMNKRKIKMT